MRDLRSPGTPDPTDALSRLQAADAFRGSGEPSRRAQHRPPYVPMRLRTGIHRAIEPRANSCVGFEYSALDSHWNAGSHLAEPFRSSRSRNTHVQDLTQCRRLPQARRRNRQAATAQGRREITVASCCAGSNRRSSRWPTTRTGWPESPRRRKNPRRKCDDACAPRRRFDD